MIFIAKAYAAEKRLVSATTYEPSAAEKRSGTWIDRSKCTFAIQKYYGKQHYRHSLSDI